MIQGIYDAAALNVIARAGMPQGFKMRLEVLQRGDLAFNVGNVLFHKIVDPCAADRGMILEGQQLPYLGKIHAVKATPADEVKTFHITVLIEPVIGARALGLREQSFLFIIAYGDDLTAGKFCQFSNFQRHDGAPCRKLPRVLMVRRIVVESSCKTCYLLKTQEKLSS